ncbi:hypothetical protein HMPREF9413_2395 [Paenibacillus sp. HGF7]|nr:hypothetical protein HMPREF9413_2395 [Paenibacillus sp. HGF7]
MTSNPETSGACKKKRISSNGRRIPGICSGGEFIKGLSHYGTILFYGRKMFRGSR